MLCCWLFTDVRTAITVVRTAITDVRTAITDVSTVTHHCYNALVVSAALESNLDVRC